MILQVPTLTSKKNHPHLAGLNKAGTMFTFAELSEETRLDGRMGVFLGVKFCWWMDVTFCKALNGKCGGGLEYTQKNRMKTVSYFRDWPFGGGIHKISPSSPVEHVASCWVFTFHQHIFTFHHWWSNKWNRWTPFPSSVGVPKNRKINCPQFGKMLGFSTDFLKKPKELWTTHPIPG